MTERTHHNHTTRDIKPVGICPACDGYHAQAARKGLAVTPNPLQTKTVGLEHPDPRIEAAAQALLEVSKIDLPEGAAEQFDGVTWETFETDAVAMLAAADAVDPLRQPGHRVEINGDDWTLQHPAECRPNMLVCPLNIAVREYDVTAMTDGNYTVVKTDDGDLLLVAELNS